jgi:CheY-like chemotaxis protein
VTKVLIVDDDSRDLLGLHMLLKSCDGVDIELASSGAEAMIVAGVFKPAVVILDFKMPQMSGPEVAVGLREVCPNAYIIGVSAHIDGSADWADGFIRKDHLEQLPPLLDLVIKGVPHPSLDRHFESAPRYSTCHQLEGHSHG